MQDHPLSSLRFRTTCNLSFAPCQADSAFEVDEEAWEEEGLMDLVCCLELYSKEVLPGPFSRSSDVDGESGQDSLQPEEELEDVQAHEQVRVSDEREDGDGECSDAAEDKENVEGEAEDEDEAQKEEQREEQEKKEEEQEESALRTKPSARRRWVIVSDDEDSPKALVRDSRLAADLQQTQKAPIVDDPQTLVLNAKNRDSDVRVREMPHVHVDAERPIKKEKEILLAHRVQVSLVTGSSQEGQAPFRARTPLGNTSPSLSSDILHDGIVGQPVKQEPISAGRTASQPQATQESEPAPELAHTKFVISIQHKPSAQHAQFSTKPHTRIGKVLTGACKSFRLDVNVAQLYLVVIAQNDQGLKEEDYFLCDRNETVETAVVGVEGRAEFMIRMPEDPAL
ncbi:hypothetical protein EDB19DRAFT_628000 [Suillus lakei]|nr:hypothetical protein EDB19DRAFT_628000 [Suillus lakei]